MDLSGLEANVREQVAQFIALPARLNTVGGKLAALSKTPGLPQGTASAVQSALDNVGTTRAQQVQVDAQLRPLLAALGQATSTIGKLGVGVSIAAIAPQIVTVMARTADLERTTDTIGQQVAGMGLRVPSAIPASAWAIGAGLVAVALYAYRKR